MFLDSAVLDEITIASDLGFIRGVTTNPLLLERAGASSPLGHLSALLAAFSGDLVFYQPSATGPDLVEDEAAHAHALDPSRVIIKMLAVPNHLQVSRRLVRESIPCAMTAVYSPAQALVAHDLGCRWVIPYVDRASRHLPEGGRLVRAIREMLDAKQSDTQILAASIKTIGQAQQAVLDGADDVSAPLDVLGRLIDHPLTNSAAVEFDEAGQRLLGQTTR